jgi:WD40 repeat protein
MIKRCFSFFYRHMAATVIIALTLTLLMLAPEIPHFRSQTAIIGDLPLAMIGGEKSGLSRPEGIAFSPSGELIAVANAHENRICFYQRAQDGSEGYETAPLFTIEGPVSGLDCPHDLSFSPDGCYLAVANRYGNSVTIYKKDTSDFLFGPLPAAIIRGATSQLIGPNAVKYAPKEQILAVANVYGNTITLYRYQDDSYEQSPYQAIQNSLDILNKPDGLAFSSDGELLAVTCQANHSIVFYQQILNSEGLYSSEPVEILKGKKEDCCLTHSLCFHPSNDYLAVSNSSGKKTLNIFKRVSDTFPRYAAFPEQSLEVRSEGGGVKGVAFSPDGGCLGLCASDAANPSKAVLIYPVNTVNAE